MKAVLKAALVLFLAYVVYRAWPVIIGLLLLAVFFTSGLEGQRKKNRRENREWDNIANDHR